LFRIGCWGGCRRGKFSSADSIGNASRERERRAERYSVTECDALRAAIFSWPPD
jgi:hypothetical protein